VQIWHEKNSWSLDCFVPRKSEPGIFLITNLESNQGDHEGVENSGQEVHLSTWEVRSWASVFLQWRLLLWLFRWQMMQLLSELGDPNCPEGKIQWRALPSDQHTRCALGYYIQARNHLQFWPMLTNLTRISSILTTSISLTRWKCPCLHFNDTNRKCISWSGFKRIGGKKQKLLLHLYHQIVAFFVAKTCIFMTSTQETTCQILFCFSLNAWLMLILMNLCAWFCLCYVTPIVAIHFSMLGLIHKRKTRSGFSWSSKIPIVVWQTWKLPMDWRPLKNRWTCQYCKFVESSGKVHWNCWELWCPFWWLSVVSRLSNSWLFSLKFAKTDLPYLSLTEWYLHRREWFLPSRYFASFWEICQEKFLEESW